ncbi:MAG: alpha/beta hydrolase [Sphingomonas sp.]|uniref:esterase/lipase family protein n=1 Tax=Sphingomonas sp. TaxID=28214 RepID=UPI001ACF0B21|nr:alpha/beta fold hydrolase [Sphingomonas sp.]MBN8809492.1 alpha/beta hydrolase [Sphingomonas sp.]
MIHAAIAQPSSHRAPSKARLAAELPRGAWTLLTLPSHWSRLKQAPRGDGRPVMLIPGLFDNDAAMGLMRRYLTGLGYTVRGWGLGRNIGARATGSDAELLVEQVAAFHDETDEPVTLVGVSLGGIMARLVAHRRPDLVREVVTVSSPFAGDPRATNVWRAFEWLTGEKIDDQSVVARRLTLAERPPVPATAIWSASDGLVNGAICHAEGEPSIEIRASHMGVHIHPQALRAIAETLAGGADRQSVGRLPS